MASILRFPARYLQSFLDAVSVHVETAWHADGVCRQGIELCHVAVQVLVYSRTQVLPHFVRHVVLAATQRQTLDVIGGQLRFVTKRAVALPQRNARERTEHTGGLFLPGTELPRSEPTLKMRVPQIMTMYHQYGLQVPTSTSYTRTHAHTQSCIIHLRYRVNPAWAHP